jgi:hypothetical protein
MKENAIGDRDLQARMVWQNHLREKKAKRETPAREHCKQRAQPAISVEHARAITRMAELELSQQ